MLTKRQKDALEHAMEASAMTEDGWRSISWQCGLLLTWLNRKVLDDECRIVEGNVLIDASPFQAMHELALDFKVVVEALLALEEDNLIEIEWVSGEHTCVALPGAAAILQRGTIAPEFLDGRDHPGTSSRIQSLIKRFGTVCAYCKRSGSATRGPDGNPWHADHVIPKSKGGRGTKDNLALACASCNLLKRDRSVDFLMKRLAARAIQDGVNF